MGKGERVTLQDISKATGLSLGSISLALNGKDGISAETKQRVVEAARTLGYERASVRLSKTLPAVSVIVERLPVAPTSDPFNRPILEGLEATARSFGYRIVMEFVGSGDDPEMGHWRQGSTAGVIILGGGDLSPEWVRAAVETHLPVVMVDHVIPGIELPVVVADNLGGAHAATRHLLEMGHRRIGFIRGPSKYWTLSERLAGFMLAMQQAGLRSGDELIPARVSGSDEKGYWEMRALLDLDEPPTAVFAVSDKAAVGAYRAVHERGLSIPRDISVVGFDDIEVSRALIPPLTTVHVSGEIMGQVAFDRLRGLIEGTETLRSSQIKWTVPTRPVLRGSVARLTGA